MPINYEIISKLPPGSPEYKICITLNNHTGEQKAISLHYLTRLAFGGLRDDATENKCLRLIGKLKRDYHIPICGSKHFGFWLKESTDD